jgi:hypothetical protein
MLWRLAGREGKQMLELVVGQGPLLSAHDRQALHAAESADTSALFPGAAIQDTMRDDTGWV